MSKITTASLRRLKTIEDLDRMSMRVAKEAVKKVDTITEDVETVRAFFRPINLFATGLRSFSGRVPFDLLLLSAVKRAKGWLKKKN